MSGNPQLGPHPDAEMLNAFTEQTLAGQERQEVAAHLAVCGRCREVVFLAQEASVEMEEAALAVAAPAASQRAMHRAPKVSHAPLLMRWRLAWIPAAALAAAISVAYTVHVRHQEPAGQMAKVENHATPVNVIPPLSPPAKSTEVVPKQAEPKTKRLPAMAIPPAPALPPSANAPLNVNAGVSQGETGVDLELKAAPEAVAAQRQQVGPQVAGEMQEPAAKKAAPMMQAEVTTAPAIRSAAGRVHGVGSLAAFASKRAGLPSGLVAVSTATALRTLLAVDKAGSAFLSTDDGEHWESIGRQWNGQAVAVRSVGEPRDKSAGSGEPAQAGFELVNDAGQVWVSVDGRSWKPK